jgi:hypothetical protein
MHFGGEPAFFCSGRLLDGCLGLVDQSVGVSALCWADAFGLRCAPCAFVTVEWNVDSLVIIFRSCLRPRY